MPESLPEDYPDSQRSLENDPEPEISDGFECFLCQYEKIEPPEFRKSGGKSLFSGYKTKAIPLYKQRSWSNDSHRDEAWLKRKDNSKRRSKSVTDEDVDELRGCIDLGFRFDSEEDTKLSNTLPALDLYFAVNKQYNDCIAKSSPLSDSSASASPSNESPRTIFGPGDSPHLVKMRLRQWAQMVACSVRQCC